MALIYLFNSFLLRWQMLRRQLGLFKCRCLRDNCFGGVLHVKCCVCFSNIHFESEADTGRSRRSSRQLQFHSLSENSSSSSSVLLDRSAADHKNNRVMQVVQISSNTITVTWMVHEPPAPTEGDSDALSLSLNIALASNLGLDSPMLVLRGIPSSGTHRIDGLDPGWIPTAIQINAYLVDLILQIYFRYYVQDLNIES